MRLLLPTPAYPADLEVDDERLLELYRWPQERWVRASMIATLDGRVAGEDGLSGSLGNEGDLRVFVLMRRTCDAVLVGAGTVVAEDYGPLLMDPQWTERRRAMGLSQHPALVIVSGSASLPPAAARRTLGPGRTIVVVGAGADPVRVAALREVAEVVAAPEPRIDPSWLLGHLAREGLGRVMVEGGPHLLGAMAGELDDLCLTTAGILGGSPGVDPLVHSTPGGVPLRGTLRHLLVEDDALFARWEFAPAGPSAAPLTENKTP